MNGFDENFVGWGGEDNAFKLACDQILGPVKRLDGPLFHLWHPPTERNSHTENHVRYLAYRGANAKEIQSFLNVKGYADGKNLV